MEYLTLIGTVTVLHFLALVSPGPDFLMILRNSLTYSRKTGIWTAVGLSCGIAVHISYCFAGIALVISQSILLFNVIKVLGAGYLVYVGFKSLTSKSSDIKVEKRVHKKDISRLAAIKIGFLTNVLNPKATLFFLSLFTMVISPETPFPIMGILSFIMIVGTGLWFSLVATFFTQKKVQVVFNKYQNWFNRVFGALLVGLGIKVALTSR